MKDSNDNKTIDFIKNDNKERVSEFMCLLSAILIKINKLTKKDNEVFKYIIFNSTNHLNLNVDVKKISLDMLIPVTNVYRHLKKLEEYEVIIKIDNNRYELNFPNYVNSVIKKINEN